VISCIAKAYCGENDLPAMVNIERNIADDGEHHGPRLGPGGRRPLRAG
jgi:hypothetical protein